jgi:hypothetical protein
MFGGRQYFQSDWFSEPAIRVDREQCVGDSLLELGAFSRAKHPTEQ